MNRSILSVIAIAVMAAAPLAADEASKAASINEIFKLAKMDQMMQKTLDAMSQQSKAMAMQQVKSSGKALPANFDKLFEEYQAKSNALIKEALAWDKLRPEMTKLYAETFTDEEIDGIVAFYKSKAGQAFVAKTPEMMNKSMASTQKLIMGILPQIQALSKEFSAKVAAEDQK